MEFPLSLPDDVPRIAAVALAVASALLLPQLLTTRRRVRWLQASMPPLAALLSAAYVVYYLRGGPRIIDATSYFLQGQALAQGMLSIPLFEPEHAELGRFLLRTTASGTPASSVIFPPGYPAVLALGFMIGAPLAVGPVIAALLTMATMSLTRRLGCILTRDASALERWVALAGLLSALCASLRYHTADTMSHGLTALCFTLAMSAALASLDGQSRTSALGVGACIGLASATRPVTALALIVCVGLITAHHRKSWKAWAMTAALPGIALWLAHQHAATGGFITTPQGAYYALSDGPPGCFRYGFGQGIGCLGEHGDFVRHNLAEGYGAWAAVGTSARRLQMHVSDVLGSWLLFPLVVGGALAAWRRRELRAVAVAPLVQLAAYAPFYFDGNYPGGGARMLADVIGVEHGLAIAGIAALARWRSWSLERVGAGTVGIGLLGFAVHLGSHHVQLRDREGGEPMFEPLGQPMATPLLLFVDTDHGYNLARAWALEQPGVRVARFKGDDHDWLTWHRAGRPTAVRYHYRWNEAGLGQSWLQPFAAQKRPDPLTIEGESLWPARRMEAGWTWASHVPYPCASAGRVHALHPSSNTGSAFAIALPRVAATTLEMTFIGLDNGAKTTIKSSIYAGDREIAAAPAATVAAGACAAVRVPLPAGSDDPLELVLRPDGAVGLDLLKFWAKKR